MTPEDYAQLLVMMIESEELELHEIKKIAGYLTESISWETDK